MIKVYCYGIFADTMTDEEFYEVEKNQRECHAAWAENFSAVSELLEMNPAPPHPPAGAKTTGASISLGLLR